MTADGQKLATHGGVVTVRTFAEPMIVRLWPVPLAALLLQAFEAVTCGACTQQAT